MRRIIVILSVAVSACTVDSSEIGSDFFNGSALDFSVIDSATLTLSTVSFDRTVTGNGDRILVGTKLDDKLGRITASAFFEVGLAGNTLPENNIAYESCALVFHYDGYSYYDTADYLTFRAYRLNETIEKEEGYMYADNWFDYYPHVLGELSFRPRPHQDDSVAIMLDDLFGKDLFNKFSDRAEVVSSQTEFLEYLKGFAVIPDTAATGSLIGFLPEAEFRIYFIDNNEVPAVKKYLSFPVNNSDPVYFTSITTDRAQTKLDDLSDPADHLPAAFTDNIAYLQSGAGLALRIDIPYLRDLKQIENFYVVQAVLEIYPVRGTAGPLTPLPQTMVVYPADGRNTMYAEYPADAFLVVDNALGRDTYYYLNITDFVRAQMALEQHNGNGLIFTTEDFNLSADRLYAAAPGSGYQTRVKIFYTTVNTSQ